MQAKQILHARKFTCAEVIVMKITSLIFRNDVSLNGNKNVDKKITMNCQQKKHDNQSYKYCHV